MKTPTLGYFFRVLSARFFIFPVLLIKFGGQGILSTGLTQKHCDPRVGVESRV
jgi:hypothetical protein